ncbi:MAG: alpha/beta hydrolase [Aeromicrobium sp.]
MMDSAYYTEAGTGPNIIMTHGTMMDWTMFTSQVEALSKDNHVIAYNHRAATDRYAESYDLNDLAEDCIAVADAAGMDKFTLVGMSMGGFMALELALKYQDRLEAIILVDTMARAYTPEQRVEFGKEFDKLDTDGPLPRAFGEWCIPLVFGEWTIANNQPLVDEWLQRWDDRPARSVYREYKSWITMDDKMDRLSEITVPVLIVHGQQDNVLPLSDCGLPMHEGLPNSRLEIIENAGHTSNCEQPEAVNRVMIDFLAGIERG